MKTTTLEQAKELKQLGVKQESEMEWVLHYAGTDHKNWQLMGTDPDDKVNEKYAAFDVAELGEMLKGANLPTYVKIWDEFGYKEKNGTARGYQFEAHARGALLIHLIKENTPGFSITEINSRL